MAKGPLNKCTEKEKMCNLMSFFGDKGQEIYLTFQWNTVQVGSGENRRDISERDILERVAEKFKAHLEAKKNPIMAAVKFDRRRQLQGETFDSFVTDLKLLARGLDMTETNKLIRNAIACKSLDERVRQRCLEKSKTLHSKQPSASVEFSRPQGTECRWCQVKTRELKLVK